MRLLKKNKQKMYYALQIGENSIYEICEDNDGNKYSLDTGETELIYSEPIEFASNISMSGSEAEAKEYGLSIADYQAVIVYDKGTVPLVEGALIWFNSSVEYKYDGLEIDVNTESGTIKAKVPEPISSDYRVIKISESLNFTKAILKATNK